ncbi:MAG: CotH kinase family protein [bacterium]|nr:CotH kinase family protein [bacterium]
MVHRFRLHFYIDHWADTLRVYYDNDENRYLPAQLTYNDTLVLDSIGVRYKGNSSYTMSSNTPKKPFEFKFNEFKDSQSLFGLHRLNVHNGMSDPSFMREAIAYGIARRYMPASRTTYADVYIDNELIGFYSIIEQMDKIFLARHFLSNGFNLYKAGNDGAPLAYRGTVQSLYESEYELKTNETENDWSRFIVMLDMLNNASDGEFVELAGEYLDFDSCLRLLAFNMVLSNFDSYSGSGRNYYFYDYETIGKFVMMPWDLNEAFGVYTNSWNVITQDIVGISNLNSRPLMRRLLENDSLRQIYQNYIATMIIEIAHADSVSAMVDRMQPVIQPHVLADNNKLYTNENFYNNLTSNVSVDIGRVIPGLKNFSRNRNASLVLQLTSERVYPGDCDNNGVVDASDVLPIGRYFQTTGSSRTTINVNWTAQRAPRWENVAAMFADANGDGTVDERDVVGIGVNWGNSHGNIMRSFPIDPGDAESIQPYRSDFHTLYRSLIGNDTAVVAMKTLLEMLFQFTTENRLPEEYSLSTNYPNPFNQSTLFRLALPEPHSVTVSVYNVLGQSIPALWERKQLTTGYHTLQLDARSLSNGIYFYRIEAGPYCAAKKFTVLK